MKRIGWLSFCLVLCACDRSPPLSQCAPDVQTDRDSQNCGSCGNACGSGSACIRSQCVPHSTTIYFPEYRQTRIDYLFVVDNSATMGPMQDELRQRIPQFFKPFQDLADRGTFPDLHIGVITGDLGAGATGTPGCSPAPGGQEGRLQSIGLNAPANCKRPVGANFIAYKFAGGGGASVSNLTPGQNLVDTLGCMMQVGTGGCSLQQPLEATRAALTGGLHDNAGFLRDDALLAVIYVTNSDDTSAPPDSDLFASDKAAEYGVDLSFRALRFGVLCGQPPTAIPNAQSNGPLGDCVPAPNSPTGSGPGKEYDVSRYVDLFSRPQAAGGVKPNPLAVVLIAIDAPEAPVEVNLSHPGDATFAGCPVLDEKSNPPCVPRLQPSCRNAGQPSFFGTPAVRLNAVLRQLKNYSVTSICENDDSSILNRSAKLIVSSVGSGCFPAKLPAAGGMPVIHCTVDNLVTNLDGTTTTTVVPACGSGGTFPCWKAERKDACQELSPDGIGITVDWNGMDPHLPNTDRITCETAP